MPKTIKPTGPKDADIVFISDTPSAKELTRQRSFVGSKGADTFDRLVQFSGINRSQTYITYLSKERVPYNNFERRFYDVGKPNGNQDLKEYKQQLYKELEEVKPNVIVPVGDEPLKAIIGEESAFNWRGSMLESKWGKVIPVMHPRDVYKNWKTFPLALHDFNRIKEESEYPELRVEPYELFIQPSLVQMQELYEKLKQSSYLSFDIETINREIDCIGLAGYTDWAVTIPFCHLNGKPIYDSVEERHIWDMIADLLADDNIGKIAQNANYDITYMERYGCPVNNLWMDTMNAHHCVYPEVWKRLSVLTSIYTDMAFYKEQIKTDRWKYNARDALSTLRAALAIEKELKDFGLDDVEGLKRADVGKHFYFDYINKITDYYRDVTNRGVKVDLDIMQKAWEKYSDLAKKAEKNLQELVGYEINPRSHQQLMDLFYGEDREGNLSSRVYKNYNHKTKKSKPTTNAEALERMHRLGKQKGKKELELATKYILNSRKYEKLRSEMEVSVDPDGRIRCDYIPSGTVTGRLSSSESSVTGTGTNLQNRSRPDTCPEARAMFIPDYPDHEFAGCDLSGADAMVVAYVSEDPNMIHVFESGQDYHAVNTALIYGIDVPNPDFIVKSDVPKNKRQSSKAVSHGANYGRGYKAIALDLGIP